MFCFSLLFYAKFRSAVASFTTLWSLTLVLALIRATELLYPRHNSN